MKKIALLFTILCAGALNGMEVTEYGHYTGMGALPREIQMLIITYINEYDNPNELIAALKATSMTNKQLRDIIEKEYGNQKGFTVLVHMLANKSNSITSQVAQKINTPAAKMYLNLGYKLANAADYPHTLAEMKQLIKDGADVNFNLGASEDTPLNIAIRGRNIEGIKLLLAFGAKPTAHEIRNINVLPEEIQQMIKDAMNK